MTHLGKRKPSRGLSSSLIGTRLLVNSEKQFKVAVVICKNLLSYKFFANVIVYIFLAKLSDEMTVMISPLEISSIFIQEVYTANAFPQRSNWNSTLRLRKLRVN